MMRRKKTNMTTANNKNPRQSAAANRSAQLKNKKRGYGLGIQTFEGNDGCTYLVFRTRQGAFNVFKEVEAKAAAFQCGAIPIKGTPRGGTPRQLWRTLWAHV